MKKSWMLAILLGLPSAVWAEEYARFAGQSAQKPAIPGLRISNDRWPDASTLRSFAEDAIRIERAGTQEEEAIALYGWVARVMTIGGSPYEGPPGREAVVADTIKFLNVYGNHWCDGNARILETLWRSLGRQAFRLYIPMRHHSLVELLWRDTDGQERWHALDVNNGWFVRNAQGWIASSEDIERDPLLVLAANQDLKMRTKGWLRTHLSQMPGHSMAMHLRRGESYSLLWDNNGYYYVNPRTRATVGSDNALYRAEGLYSRFIGGGEVVFVPDLTGPRWVEDLVEQPRNAALEEGRISPQAASATASFTYPFDFPHLIADAAVEATIFQADARAQATIEFSADGGKSWNHAWSSPGVGRNRLRLNLGKDRDGAGQPSVLGMYSYLVRFNLQAESDPGAVSFADLKFTNRVMLNKMTLPNLQPGWNRLKAASQSIAPDSALRITVEWEDKDGIRRAERSASRLPLEFDVFANCSGGFGVRMRSIRLDVVPAASPVQPHEVTSGPEANRIRAIIESGLAKDRTALESLAEAMKAGNEELRYWAADALGKIGDPRAIPALVGALDDEYSAVRMSACVALGDLKARDAVAALIRVVTGKVPSGKGYRLFIPEEVGEVRWMAAQALGRIGDATAVGPLVEVLGGADGDLGLYVAQALGDLGDSRAVPALMEKAKRRNEPELRGIVEALGRLGDPRARSILLELLETGKEDVRHAAASALERMKGSPQSH